MSHFFTFGQIKPSDFRHSGRNEAARGRHHYLSPRASSSSVTRVKAKWDNELVDTTFRRASLAQPGLVLADPSPNTNADETRVS